MVTPRRASPAGTGQVTHSPSRSSAHTAGGVGGGAVGVSSRALWLPHQLALLPQAFAQPPAGGAHAHTARRLLTPRISKRPKGPSAGADPTVPRSGQGAPGSPWEMPLASPCARAGRAAGRALGRAQAAWTQTHPERRPPAPACMWVSPAKPWPRDGAGWQAPRVGGPLGPRMGGAALRGGADSPPGPWGAGGGCGCSLLGAEPSWAPPVGRGGAGLSGAGERRAVLEGGPSAGALGRPPGPSRSAPQLSPPAGGPPARPGMSRASARYSLIPNACPHADTVPSSARGPASEGPVSKPSVPAAGQEAPGSPGKRGAG